MPQMYPLLWLNLFVMFLMSMILILVIQYFLSLNLKLDLKSSFHYEKDKIWKW